MPARVSGVIANQWGVTMGQCLSNHLICTAVVWLVTYNHQKVLLPEWSSCCHRCINPTNQMCEREGNREAHRGLLNATSRWGTHVERLKTSSRRPLVTLPSPSHQHLSFSRRELTHTRVWEGLDCGKGGENNTNIEAVVKADWSILIGDFVQVLDFSHISLQYMCTKLKIQFCPRKLAQRRRSSHFFIQKWMEPSRNRKSNLILIAVSPSNLVAAMIGYLHRRWLCLIFKATN